MPDADGASRAPRKQSDLRSRFLIRGLTLMSQVVLSQLQRGGAWRAQEDSNLWPSDS